VFKSANLLSCILHFPLRQREKALASGQTVKPLIPNINMQVPLTGSSYISFGVSCDILIKGQDILPLMTCMFDRVVTFLRKKQIPATTWA